MKSQAPTWPFGPLSMWPTRGVSTCGWGSSPPQASETAPDGDDAGHGRQLNSGQSAASGDPSPRRGLRPALLPISASSFALLGMRVFRVKRPPCRHASAPRGRGRAWRRTAAPLVAAVLLVGACADSGGSTSERSGPSAPRSAGASGGAGGTTSADPLDAVRREVAAVQSAYFRAYEAALAVPGDVRRVERLLSLYTSDGPGRGGIAARMRGFADRQVAGRPGPKGYYLIEETRVANLPPRGRATATVCTYDDAVLYDAARRGQGGKEIVINDDVSSTRARFRWVQEDGAWKLDGGEVVDRWEGENRCPAEGS